MESAVRPSLGHLDSQLAPTASWRDIGVPDHFAQFFEADSVLIDAVCDFGATGLASGGAVIVIATAAHLAEIERRWTERRVDFASARRLERYVPVEASALLERLMLGDWPRARRFAEHVEPIIAAAQRFPAVRAFGEMVGLLWAEGRHAAALRLEELWNELAQRYGFMMFCGYPMPAGFAASPEALRRVCHQHSLALPSESYVGLEDPVERLAEICDLQNRARGMEQALRERRAAERLLARRERELEKKVRELADLGRYRDECLAMLGHELRNPLAAIRNAAAVLASEARSDPSRQALCDVVSRQAGHMSRLLDDLLDMSRLTQGKVSLHRERVELATLVARAVETSRALIDERCQHLEMLMPQEPVRLEGDPLRLAQALGNLLHNAAKYTPPGGHIRMSASVQGDYLTVAVADTGIGIAPEMLSHVFEPFVQTDQALARAQGGLGIGLTLVRSIIELHGGTVDAASEGPGRGTEVTIRLPAAQRESDADRGAREDSKRVLIVDDNRDAADSLVLLLELEGHEARAVGDGDAAIAAAEELSPHLIVMDIGLPGVDGYAAARELRAAGCTARLVAVTGYGRPEDRQRAAEAGFDEFFVKPLDPHELERLLGGRSLTRARGSGAYPESSAAARSSRSL